MIVSITVLDQSLAVAPSVATALPVVVDQQQLQNLNMNFMAEGSSASTQRIQMQHQQQQLQQPEWHTMGSSRDEAVSDNVTGGSLSSTANTSPAMSASIDTDEASRDMMPMNANFMDDVSPEAASGASSSTGHMNMQVRRNWKMGIAMRSRDILKFIYTYIRKQVLENGPGKRVRLA